jgi:hypothetical protein
MWKADKRSEIEVAQTYGIPLFTLLTCLKNWDLVDKQALQGGDVSYLMGYIVMWKMKCWNGFAMLMLKSGVLQWVVVQQ